jgi:hypothetical protein
MEDSLNWLKFNSQPWSEVKKHWKVTSKYRVDQFLVEKKEIETFKLLLDPKADDLVSSFETLNKCC